MLSFLWRNLVKIELFLMGIELAMAMYFHSSGISAAVYIVFIFQIFIMGIMSSSSNIYGLPNDMYNILSLSRKRINDRKKRKEFRKMLFDFSIRYQFVKKNRLLDEQKNITNILYKAISLAQREETNKNADYMKTRFQNFQDAISIINKKEES